MGFDKKAGYIDDSNDSLTRKVGSTILLDFNQLKFLKRLHLSTLKFIRKQNGPRYKRQVLNGKVTALVTAKLGITIFISFQPSKRFLRKERKKTRLFPSFITK